MKKMILAAMVLSMSHAAVSQQIVTLWQCYDSAAAVTVLSGERPVYSEISALRDQNIASAWLPSLDINGSLTYQSDIVDMSKIIGSLPVPPGSLPSIPHEQYRATADINQVIWDGGVVRSARAVERVVNELNMQQNEADVYRLREQVNNYYFSAMLLASQKEVAEVLISELDARIEETFSGVRNGVVAEVTMDVLRAERIKAGQALTELNHNRDALISALKQKTGMTGLKDAAFQLPEPVITGEEAINNPDMRMFDVRSRQLEVSKNLLKSQRMPKAFGFAQAGYGNPPGRIVLMNVSEGVEVKGGAATLMIPSGGRMTLFGLNTVTDYRELRNHIGYMPGRFSLYQDLTVEENLNFHATIFGTIIKENYHLIEPVYKHIEPFKKRLAGRLSGGMKQKLALSCALIHRPKILILDEPTTGVDAVSRTEFRKMLTGLKSKGIIVSTPYMDEALRCDRIALIQSGKILGITTPDNIRRS